LIFLFDKALLLTAGSIGGLFLLVKEYFAACQYLHEVAETVALFHYRLFILTANENSVLWQLG